MSTQRANSTSSTSSTSSVEYIKSQRPADICIPKGKWYDCMRPVPGYQSFGGISRFDRMRDPKYNPELEEGNWTEEVHAKMSEVNSGKKAGR